MSEPFASEVPVAAILALPAVLLVGTAALVVGTVTLSGALTAAAVVGRSYRAMEQTSRRFSSAK